MLAYFESEEDFGEIKKWYGGYYFGETEIYNPWSIMNYIRNCDQVPNFPRKYWANSSSKRMLIRRIVDAAENFISTQLHDTICHFHLSYYREFLVNLLKNNGYLASPNRESGNGRPDIVMTELKFRGRAMILELKISDTIQGMEKKCEEALAQIEAQKYTVPIAEDGYQPILKYAICFFKKGCVVRKTE